MNREYFIHAKLKDATTFIGRIQTSQIVNVARELFSEFPKQTRQAEDGSSFVLNEESSQLVADTFAGLKISIWIDMVAS